MTNKTKPAKQPKQEKPPKKSTKRRSRNKVPVVAIGASAGGLEPYEQFFDAMPPETGVAFVIIQHLSPDFQSMMDELLARHSSMKIKRVENGMVLEPNTIFLNTPRVDMTVRNGVFETLPTHPTDKLSLPIDLFFDSLAKEYGHKAIAVVFSGTGSDGTRGAQAVKEAGGTILVQSPQSAKFDGMPQSVIDKGLADAVALPSEIPPLIERVRNGEILEPQDLVAMSTPTEIAFARLRDRFGTDFGYYKPATITRRINRRAEIKNMDIADYVRSLEQDLEEVDTLYSDLLIDVTFFFRDPEGFEALKKQVVEPLCKKMSAERQIRIWVPGCASGAEPYSLAIAFAEYARENSIHLNLKILATDVHQRSLGAATEGVYPESSLKDVDAEQLERYFEKRGDFYQVTQSIRRLIVFSQHNILRDPPFTRLDLISCRNVLIYFRTIAQQKTLELFHFGLNVDGFLFLGPSESLAKLENEFTTLDRRWRIYQKRRDVRLAGTTSMLPRRSASAVPLQKAFEVVSTTTVTPRPVQKRRAHDQALEQMLKSFAPPGFLLNKMGEIVHVFGDAGDLLSVGAGTFSTQITDHLSRDLSIAVSAGLDRISASDRLEFRRRVNVKDDGDTPYSVRVSLSSIGDGLQDAEHILLVLETEKSDLIANTDNPQTLEASETSEILQGRIAELERELTATEESVQSIVEELQTSNEELQATNEELMASNEELQSTNEELHSVNEELYTVSTEHQLKIDELTLATSDMDHLLKATSIGIIFLDENGQIRRFTPSATEAFNLLPHDVGRPFAHVTNNFSDIDIDGMVETALGGGAPLDAELVLGDAAYVLRVLPYSIAKNEANGAVITLIDVTHLKESERLRLEAKAVYQSVVDSLVEYIVRWDSDSGEITFCNQGFADLADTSTGALIGTSVFDAFAQARFEGLGDLSDLSPDEGKTDFIFVRNDESAKGVKDVRAYRRQIRAVGGDEGEVIRYQATGMDVTDQYKYLQALESIAHIGDTPGVGFDHMLQTILKVGSEYLRLPRGILSEIIGDEYHVRLTFGIPPETLKPGDVLPLGETMCCQLPEGDGIFARDDIGKSPISKHACYKMTGIESFIGIRTFTSEGTHGSLSFSCDAPRGKEFTDTEKTMIQLLARLAGFAVERSQKMLELDNRTTELADVNDSLNRFAYVAAHDLQEPLRKIVQFGELLESEYAERFDEDGQFYVEVMKTSATRMRSLLQDLLQYSSVSAKALEIKQADLNGIIDDILYDLEARIEESHADVRVGTLGKIECDETAASHVFQNIIANAIKYRHPDRTPVVKLVRKDTKEGAEIYVRDNGIGMTSDTKQNIFEPFVRLHSTDRYQGSGIGLAICKEVCDRHGWSISMKSEEGKYSEFVIYIPAGLAKV